MPPTVVVLIRHAETTWNAEQRLQGSLDAPLSERGRWQVDRLVQTLQATPLAALYSSPLERALATARPLAVVHGLPVHTVEGLREMHQGEWEGRLVAEVAVQYGETLQMWRDSPAETRLPGGETLQEVQARALAALADMTGRHGGQTIAVVAHGGVNKTILLGILGLPLSSHWRIRQANACINIVEVDGAGVRVAGFNDTAHLEALPGLPAPDRVAGK